MTTPTNLHSFIAAGLDGDHTGAMTAWRGSGTLTRAQILAALQSAGLPVKWAPRVQSDVAQLGRAVSPSSFDGLIPRRAKAAPWTGPSENQTRPYRVRWTIMATPDTTAAVGTPAGTVMMTVDLQDGSSELVIRSADNADVRQIRDAIVERYETALAGEVYQADRITAWLRDLLAHRLGCVQIGPAEIYIPAGARDAATRLLGAMQDWGANWMFPPIPVVTTEALTSNLVATFQSDVDAVAQELVRARDACKGDEIRPKAAVRLAQQLEAISTRAHAYSALFGTDPLASVVARVAAVKAELDSVCRLDDVGLRFALLELDGGPTGSAAPEPAPPAIRAAERAADAARDGDHWTARPDGVPPALADGLPIEHPTDAAVHVPIEAYRRRYAAAMERSGMPPRLFRSACVRASNDRIPPGQWTPRQWAELAELAAEKAAPR